MERQENQIEDKEKRFSTFEMARFSSAVTAYRIVRLSVELFLVVRVQELDISVSKAGTVYLLYSIASILAGLIFMYCPTICFGNLTNAIGYFIVSAISMFGGFIAMFQVRSFGWMVAFAMLTGFGSGTWYINFQTITNLSFPQDQIGSVAHFQQLFESFGFLAPSICLAITTAVGGLSITVGTDLGEDSNSFASSSTLILAFIGIGFFILSGDQIIKSAARIQQKDDEASLGMMVAIKTFFRTSIVKYFWINTLLLALANILMGTLSLITEIYFGLDPVWLWLAAIGFPVGGIISAGTSMMNKTKRSGKTVLISGLYKLLCSSVCCIILGFTVFPSNKDKMTKSMLFFFGLILGMLYVSTFTASIELWLLRLKEYNTSFVSRASAINGIANQAVIASIFQLQTILVDHLVEVDGGDKIASVVFFAPLIFLCILCLISARDVAHIKNPFGWPMHVEFSAFVKGSVSLFECLGASTIADSAFFGSFQNLRTTHFSAQLNDVTVQRGPVVAETASLNPIDFKDHLKSFVKVESHNDEWWSSKATLCDILIDNQKAFEARLELIEKAASSICMITWLIDESKTGNQLVDAFIKRAEEGIKVRVIVDAVTLHYLYQKKTVRGMDDMLALERLANSGVEVQMLDTIPEETEPYVIGTHRKILMVDDTWVITGGRNNSDDYFTSNGFHYCDADVLLKGSFRDSIGVLYKSLWEQARGVESIFGIPKMKKETDKEIDASCPTSLIKDRSVYSGNMSIDTIPFPISNSQVSLVSSEDILEDCSNDLNQPTYENKRDNNDIGTKKRGSDEENPFFRSKRGIEQEDSMVSTGVPDMAGLVGNVTVIHLDHKAGNKDGYDITYSALLFLIETATKKIDLLMGYFQLFPDMETAIARAVARGVQVNLTTNSDCTNDVPFQNKTFRHALERLLELGVNVFATVKDQLEVDGGFCLHYKLAIFDERVAFMGSWNCTGTSVFFDSDFSVVLFDDDTEGSEEKTLFHSIQNLHKSLFDKGRVVQMKMIPADSFKVPFYYYLSSKSARTFIERGY